MTLVKIRTLALTRHEFLDAHAVIDVAHVNSAVLPGCQIVPPVDLPIVIAEAAPFREDISGKVEFEKLSAVGRIGLQIAAVHDVEQIVRSDRDGPWEAFQPATAFDPGPSLI